MSMDADAARWASVEGALREILSKQSATDARLSELFRSHSTVQADAKQARELGTKITTILEEQNVMVRLSEQRAELRGEDAALRQDMVAAYTRIKEDVNGLRGRVNALEAARTEGRGMAKAARLAMEAVKVVLAAGGGAVLLKLFGG